MLLKKIRLENIRSYTNQEVIFPEGSTLLAGNIGSGKTSVLLAIDFALFGLRKGNLSGASLLRNGTNKGSVEFHFSVDDKNIVIKRTLKRGGAIAQDSGYIILNGEKKELAPVELKQFILDVLNYPKDMVTRSKDLVFRYTVYTPQDEMKQILLSDNDIRLETLRKVFGIDKYKLIKDNTKILIAAIREKNREFSGYISDLNSKINESEILKRRTLILGEEILKLIPVMNNLDNEIKNGRQELKDIESRIKSINEIKLQIEINEHKLNSNLERIKENNERIKKTEIEIEEINKEVRIDIDINHIKQNIQNTKIAVERKEEELYSIRNKMNEARIRMSNSSKIIDDIHDLNICPVCRQEVNKNYKNDMIIKENDIISHMKSELSDLERQEKEISFNIQESKKEIEKFNSKEKEYEINKIKLNNISSKLTDIESLKELSKRLKSEIGEINVRNGPLYKELEEFKDIEDRYNKKSNEIENLQRRYRDIEINKASLETEKRNIEKNIEKLKLEIEKKEEKRRYMEKLTEINEWLDNYFIVSLEMIENNIMLKLHSDFNSLFQKWFDTLVDDEDITIRLNQDFSPLIQQNNHDIDYTYLSGGEKTAAALAYRLALNQVINNLMSAIKTNDLIILDEPTDGFSDEQIDRIRHVLRELKLKQILIVSHEPKIETFVDNVIRFKKENHITTII